MAEGSRALDAWRRFATGVRDASRWRAVGAFNHCEVTEGGVWATVLEPPAGDTARDRPAGRFKLVFIADNGTRSEAHPALASWSENFALRGSETNWVQDEITTTRMGTWSLVDLDGDHVSEVLIPFTERVEERGESAFVIVWKATAARVEAFAPAMGLHPVALQDIDNDGRPDLLTHAELTGGYNNGVGVDATLHGPRLVALARSGGTFITSSGQALTYNRTQCPVAPTSFIVANDPAQSAKNVACATLWRVPRAQVLSTLQRECPPAVPHSPESCSDWMRALVSIANATPQVDLRAALVFSDTEIPRLDADSGMTDAPLRHVVLRVEGVGVFTPTVDLGNLDGVCNTEEPDARLREVTHYKCWWAGAGNEFRVLRVGGALMVQRRDISEESPPTPWRDLGRVPVAPTMLLRASDER